MNIIELLKTRHTTTLNSSVAVTGISYVNYSRGDCWVCDCDCNCCEGNCACDCDCKCSYCK